MAGLKRGIAAIADHVVRVDGDGRIRSWSAAAEQTFARPSREVLGQRLTDVVMTGSAARSYGEILESLRTGLLTHDVPQIHVVRPDEADLTGELPPCPADAGPRP